MIPALTTNGTLPPGIHVATLPEVKATFATTPYRRSLYGGLLIALGDLRACKCARAWLDGSYVTDKQVPGDYDLCWDLTGVDWGSIDPVLLDVDFPRATQTLRYRGDVLPNTVESDSGLPYVEFFQQNKNTGGLKGIIELRL